MARRIAVSVVVSIAVCAGSVSLASAANPIRLVLDQGSAFAILGHSCGGIQEKAYVRGFAANGYPQGNVALETKCGGSGRGGGYHVTTYTGTASVVWTWFGETRSDGTPGAPLEALEATDAFGDRVYNVGTAAYLETGNPPLQPPAAPTNVSASILLSDEPPEDLRMTVGWSVAPETARLLKYSTVTATPVGSSAPVLTASPGSYFSSAVLQPVEPNTTYSVTVTNTDSEGTSPPSTPIEIRSPNSDGEAEKEHKTTNTCAVNQGTIKLKPGLTEKPAVQSLTVSGEMSGCEGPAGFESGKYTARLATTEEVTCSTLSGATLEGTKSKSFSINWQPAEEGSSKGSLILPLSEAPLTGMTGSLTGGPFETATNMSAASVFESFTGASLCGVPQGKKEVVKPVKAGTFSTSEVEFG
jgi:hypothetical protein